MRNLKLYSTEMAKGNLGPMKIQCNTCIYRFWTNFIMWTKYV